MKNCFPSVAGVVAALLLLPWAEAAPPNAPPPATASPAKTRHVGVIDGYGRLLGQIVPDYFGMGSSRLIANVSGVDVGVLVSPVDFRSTVNGVVTSRYLWQTTPNYLARYTRPDCAGSPIIEDRGYVELDAVRVTMVFQSGTGPAYLLIASPAPAQPAQVMSQGDPLAGTCANVSFTVMARAVERTAAWPYKELYPVRLP